MTQLQSVFADTLSEPARMAPWIRAKKPQTPEEATFLSGAALAHAHLVFGHDAVPSALLRARLALRATEVCMKYAGRPERAKDLRDALHFLRPGDHPGPAGAVYALWQRAIGLPVQQPAFLDRLCNAQGAARMPVTADDLHSWLGAAHGGPVGSPVMQAATALECVLNAMPQQEPIALIAADIALARALGWTHVMPLLALGLRRRDMRRANGDLHQACHRAMSSAVIEAAQLATDLSRRAARLRDVSKKLRAKGAKDAVTVFLTQDAISPVRLVSLGSERAARRLCQRLETLGAVRELTGRDTFRLYGL